MSGKRNVSVSVKETDEGYSIVEVNLDGVIEPCIVHDVVIDVYQAVMDTKNKFAQGFVVSGRMPMWLMCAIVHTLHPSRWVATYDPRLNAGVIVMSHVVEYKEGDLIPVQCE